MTAAEREVSDVGRDDIVLPYAVESLSTRGRLVRLGAAIDAILKRHAYPEPIGRVVGEAAALGVLLGSMLKLEGRFQLQTKTEGPLHMLVVDFDAPSHLRALARFDDAALAKRIASGGEGDLLGEGHLAFTVDPGGEMSRYQGVVALEGQGLERAAHAYFERSEQIPTLVRLAVGQSVTPRGVEWRAGGLLAQFLPNSPERRRRWKSRWMSLRHWPPAPARRFSAAWFNPAPCPMRPRSSARARWRNWRRMSNPATPKL